MKSRLIRNQFSCIVLTLGKYLIIKCLKEMVKVMSTAALLQSLIVLAFDINMRRHLYSDL